MDQKLTSQPPQPQRLSREGLLLIKSFAGFRPQAVRRRDGVLIIGYGHSQTARPDVSITEAEAELLLLHDLIPVIKAIHSQITAPLSQHQFDALVSFVLSIGIERFTTSDVLTHLNRQDFALAANSMLGWSDRISPPVDAPYRRRSAERALFEIKEGQPLELAQLLTAPITQNKPAAKTEPDRLQSEAATVPVIRHPEQKAHKSQAADYGALAFIAAIGALALIAGYLSFKKDLPPSHQGDGALIIGVGLIIAGSTFIAAAAWNFLQKRNNRLFI